MDGTVFTLSNIYGPTFTALKGSFFQELRDIGNRVVGVWAMLGDFNLLLSLSDKNGPPSSVSNILAFRNAISSIGLFDLPLSNRSFTWTNGRPTPMLERLDRALLSQDWLLHFPRSTLRALPRPTSDHSPLLLTAFSFVPAAHLFRFESFWLRHREAANLITTTWASTSNGTDPVFRFSNKLGSVAGNLKDWSVGLSLAIKRQGSTYLAWIDWLDRAEELRCLRVEELQLRRRLKMRFDELSLQDELRWKQRSRVQWLKAGDANSRFFHLKANSRRIRNYITKLAVGSSTFSDHASIADQLYSHFERHLCSEGSFAASINFQCLFPEGCPDLQNLDAPFTLEEVKHAVFNSAADKAPGPDDFPMLFYQRFWETVKGDIMGILSHLHSGHLDLAPINQSWICLIPKKLAPMEVRDYRPISLVNDLSKIISKVLAFQLQSVLDELINPFQTAFVKGRTLQDNFLTAHILSHHLHSSGQRASLLKIDFDRAFDQVSWEFLFGLLRARGFSTTWVGWIKAILHSTTVAVLLNGTPGCFFRCSRGLRQGDPLSPLLFILCIDVFYRMLNQVIYNSLLSPIRVDEVCVHTLQFADDLLLFFNGSSTSARVIRTVLDAFSTVSGLKVNFTKSALIPINLPSAHFEGLANLFGCSVASFPITYLGLPLSPRAPSRVDFLPLIEKLDKRLAGWKGQLLSRAGRLVLINSVLSTIPAFFCSLFRIPGWALKYIDRMRRGFF